MLKNIYHFLLAWAGAIIYNFPSRRLFAIGITGTKGKTTSVELLHAALQAAGYKTAALSSAHLEFGAEIFKNPKSNTMPGRFFIQRFLSRAVKTGCTHAIIEVTSQGVVQHRGRFIDFNVAALTNLHPEHIESHGSFEKYRAAKATFFSDAAKHSSKPEKLFVINSEVADRKYFEEAANGGKKIFYSQREFVSRVLGGDMNKVSSWLASDFNLANAALVYAIAAAIGANPALVLKSFKEFQGVPGRLEFVSNGRKNAVIDYALTPDSLEALYTYLTQRLKTQNSKQGKLIGVFGSAGGGRDKWKRPELGKVAGKYCDHIYLTTDDSYDEDPNSIIADIAKGIGDQNKYTIVIDRKSAITEALKNASQNDIVAITGMGSQSYTYGPGGAKKPWSDRAAAEEILIALRNTN